jgi:hypothetical protein
MFRDTLVVCLCYWHNEELFEEKTEAQSGLGIGLAHSSTLRHLAFSNYSKCLARCNSLSLCFACYANLTEYCCFFNLELYEVGLQSPVPVP